MYTAHFSFLSAKDLDSISQLDRFKNFVKSKKNEIEAYNRKTEANTDTEREKINIYPRAQITLQFAEKWRRFHKRIFNFNHQKCKQGVSNSEKKCIDREC